MDFVHLGRHHHQVHRPNRVSSRRAETAGTGSQQRTRLAEDERRRPGEGEESQGGDEEEVCRKDINCLSMPFFF